jgi:peptidoglycan/LPS O-acetylase OafA/YrhL
VIAVVMAHAHMPGFGGGFLGVDVFFVISGYLITGILLRDADASGISIAAFYERRIRRIFPALVTIMLASTATAAVVFSPYEFKDYAIGLVASVLFVANLYFMAGTDYFSPRYEVPLLHLWSLGVEEQFYIAYPFLLRWMLRDAKRRLFPILVSLFAASLALSELFAEVLPKDALAEWIVGFQPSTFAFYFTGTRIWELLIGAMIACRCVPGALQLKPLPHLPWAVREIFALAGLLLIVVPVRYFTHDTSWPGIHALLPCTGAAMLLVLHEQEHTAVGRFLSLPPMAGIGLMSYSLYLWHWPLFEFYHRLVLREPTRGEYVVLIALAVIAAWLSWRLVERPLRYVKAQRRHVFRAAGYAGAAMTCLAVAIYAGGGYPPRFPPAIQTIYGILDRKTPHRFDRYKHLPNCYVSNHGKPYSFERCFRLSATQPNIVMWGDSFVGNYFLGFHEAGRRTGINVIEASHFDCRPVMDATLVTRTCAAFNRSIMAHLDRRVSAVVIAARFFNHQNLVPSLVETAEKIARSGIPVIVIGASLEYREAGPFYVARYVETGDKRWLDSRRSLKPDLVQFDRLLQRRFAHTPGVTYLSVLDTACRHNTCPMMANGLSVQSDFGHLTVPGSLLMGKLLWPQVYRKVVSTR